MPRYRSSVDVSLPVAETFAFVTDFRNAARWDPLVSRAEKTTPGPVGRGTRFVLVRRFALGSGARDWALLDERLRFILTYFRSRQTEESQLEPPFTASQLEDLEAGRVPVGEL